MGAATNANLFRDITGLSGSQQNALTAMNAASSLATNFGDKAYQLGLAKLKFDQQQQKTGKAIDEKAAALKRAKDKKLITTEEASAHMNQAIKQATQPEKNNDDHEPLIDSVRKATIPDQGVEATRITPSMVELVSFSAPLSPPVPQDPFISQNAAAFAATDVNRMEAYYDAHMNGSNDPEDCITILNGAVRELLSDANQSVGSRIDLTMENLANDGHASVRRDIGYRDVNNNNTVGVTKPETARESIAVVGNSACSNAGWYVFGLSVADGYHSMVLAVNNTANSPSYYLADQIEGWVLKSAADLDAKILEWTQNAWDAATSSTRPKTRTTLWRLIP